MAKAEDYLQTIRQNLRGRMLASPLCDGVSFANEIEKIYRKIWKENQTIKRKS